MKRLLLLAGLAVCTSAAHGLALDVHAANGNLALTADDGVVTAVWGDVTVAVNLGDRPRTVGGHALAPYGWHAEGPNLRAGHLQGQPAFVEVDGKRWTYTHMKVTREK